MFSNNLQGVIGSKSLLRTVEKSPCKLIIYSAKSVYEFIQKVITKTLMILALLTWKMKSKNHQQQIWIYMISIHSKLNSWISNYGGGWLVVLKSKCSLGIDFKITNRKCLTFLTTKYVFQWSITFYRLSLLLWIWNDQKLGDRQHVRSNDSQFF